MKTDKKILLPFILTLAVILLDQLTKALVVKYIPLEYSNGRLGIGPCFFGDFLRIIRVSNPGVAFSMGDSMPLVIRRLCFGIVPLIVIGLVINIYFRNDEFTTLQRWVICGIIGGGIGNIIDRFFRADGVIDFIDVKFYGLFGFERWPTFNVADSAVVVCGIILIISYIIFFVKEEKAKRNSK